MSSVIIAIVSIVAGQSPGVGQWHGYERQHFEVDGHAAYVVIPKEPAIRKPWVWRARFPDYHPEVDQVLLEKGFHIAYVDVANEYGAPAALDRGDQFYEYVTTRYQLSPKVVLEGVSRGGLFVYNWAARHPERVACIYADTPVLDIKSWPGGRGAGLGSPDDWKRCLEAYGMTEAEALAHRDNPVDRAELFRRAGIPILHIISENDQVVPPDENTLLFRSRFPEPHRSRLFRVMTVSKGTEASHGHHFPHPNPQAVANFIFQHAVLEGGYISTGATRSLEQIETIYAEMPPLGYQPPADRGAYLPRTRERLQRGGSLRVVMLGDSLINDTSRSQWHLLLQRRYPQCQITKITSVRGSTGCWWYRDNQRVQVYVLDQQPDLVVIGGISQRGDMDAVEAVVNQIRSASSADILLMSGPFGRVDPNDDTQWSRLMDPDGESERVQLMRLADRLQVEFLDMQAAWGDYIRRSGKPVDWFKRDVVHANERGEQIIGRILYRYLALVQ